MRFLANACKFSESKNVNEIEIRARKQPTKFPKLLHDSSIGGLISTTGKTVAQFYLLECKCYKCEWKWEIKRICIVQTARKEGRTNASNPLNAWIKTKKNCSIRMCDVPKWTINRDKRLSMESLAYVFILSLPHTLLRTCKYIRHRSGMSPFSIPFAFLISIRVGKKLKIVASDKSARSCSP